MKKLHLDFSDALAIAGVALVSSGLWLIFKPAAVIAVGLYCVLCSFAVKGPTR